ncbi:MAG: hypothetical protein GEU73_10695 [Chloroflexi bacterium]|nr:hypothetical protein [Chloroflexota bacterium]
MAVSANDSTHDGGINIDVLLSVRDVSRPGAALHRHAKFVKRSSRSHFHSIATDIAFAMADNNMRKLDMGT